MSYESDRLPWPDNEPTNTTFTHFGSVLRRIVSCNHDEEIRRSAMTYLHVRTDGTISPVKGQTWVNWLQVRRIIGYKGTPNNHAGRPVSRWTRMVLCMHFASIRSIRGNRLYPSPVTCRSSWAKPGRHSYPMSFTARVLPSSGLSHSAAVSRALLPPPTVLWPAQPCFLSRRHLNRKKYVFRGLKPAAIIMRTAEWLVGRSRPSQTR